MVCFAEVEANDLEGIAGMLQIILGKLSELLDDPAYNFVIDTSSKDKSGDRYYYWHLEKIPRLNTRTGFEIGSGMNINHILPETCAENLKDLKYQPHN